MKKNGYFELIEKEDGVYVHCYAPVDGGEYVSYEDVSFFLGEKKVEFDTIEVNKNIQNKVEEFFVSSQKMIAENEFIKLIIDPEGLAVRGRFYPPIKDGRKMDKEEIIQRLQQAGVQYGISTKNIDIFCLVRPYCTDILLAKAKKPVHGTDARIEYNFDYEKTTKPSMNEDGSVDFHNLDMFESVKEGDLLATLIPENPGEPGTNVYGKPINPRKVSKARLRYGNNISLSEDGNQIFSKVSGHVALAGDMVFVSDVYEVPADVGASTGDIDYNGSVEVKGNVITGYTVKASGNITVNGVVEGATLIAGGNIVLKRGIQGMSRGCLQAGGSIFTKFIENSKVSAGDSIMTDAIMHSKVVASKEIKVQGRRGLITGGELRAGNLIEATTIGSTMGTQTTIEVGMDPKVIERFHEVEAKIKENEEVIDKMKKVVLVLKKKLQEEGSLSEDKMTQLKMAGKKVIELTKQQEELSDEYFTLEEALEDRTAGKVIAMNCVYPGVKLTIANATSHIQTVTQHSAFVRDGADVRVRPI